MFPSVFIIFGICITTGIPFCIKTILRVPKLRFIVVPTRQPELCVNESTLSNQICEVDPNLITYYLFTTNNPSGRQMSCDDFANLSSTIVMISAGWLMNASTSFLHLMKDAYLKTRGFPVILVDWSTYSLTEQSAVGYASSYCSTPLIGKAIGDFLSRCASLEQIANFHFLGHSLGAHVAGNCGKQIFKNTRKHTLDVR